MRFQPVLVALSLLLLPPSLQAEETPPIPLTAPPPEMSSHRGWEQHFAKANTAHDGHLTLEQATLGYAAVARHFQEIDMDRNGYVTIEDVRAWHARARAARHPTGRHASERDERDVHTVGQSHPADAEDQSLQPRQAFHHVFREPPLHNAAAPRAQEPVPVSANIVESDPSR